MAKPLYVYTGSDWVPVASELESTSQYLPIQQAQAPFRNLIINGAMQVAQRGTSTASITTAGYYTADRWTINISSQGTWTQSVENDAPTGSGFRKSLKMLCTTADAAPAAGDYVLVRQIIEGQNLQSIRKGTADAQLLTISFWVKSNVTGTYVCSLYDADNNRLTGQSYTISASATWEKKTITFPADTTGAFDNDNGGSLYLDYGLGAGTDRTSGTLNASWATYSNANYLAGQTNLAAATNNYWQITGVQLEVGAVATPFEFKPYAQDLAECQRYYWRNTPGTPFGTYCLAQVRSTTQVEPIVDFPVAMRVGPTSIEYSNLSIERAGIGTYSLTVLSINVGNYNGPYATKLAGTNNTSGASAGQSVSIINANNSAGYLAFNAEL